MTPADKVVVHRRPYWKGAHRDWKFWVVVLFLIALMVFYELSDNFALRGRGPVPVLAPHAETSVP